MLTADHDETGLWYVSDREVFVAAPSAGDALELAHMARTGFKDVPAHAWFNHARSGKRFCIPLPDWQTSAQRRATVTRLLKHLADNGAGAQCTSLPDTPSPRVPRSRWRRRSDEGQP